MAVIFLFALLEKDCGITSFLTFSKYDYSKSFLNFVNGFHIIDIQAVAFCTVDGEPGIIPRLALISRRAQSKRQEII